MTAPDRAFAALADPTRRALFESLARGGPATATELARERPISRQAVAKHLGVLELAGLVAAERAGRETRFTAAPDRLDDVTRWIEEVGAAWDRRLERLQRQLGR
ncbi:MAG: ArsR/SmtB family transcription factor [Actinomycetota bacterium]